MEIYRIVERETGEEVGVYMPPTARDEYNFGSVEEARDSNVHGIYKDKAKYKIRKYKLVLVEDDCDPPTEEEIEFSKEKKKQEELDNHKCDEIARKMYGKSYQECDFLEALKVREELLCLLIQNKLGE